MISESLAVWIVLGIAFLVTALRSYPAFRAIITAPSSDRKNRLGARLSSLGAGWFGHKRLLKKRYSGVLHSVVVISFIVLLSSIIESFGSGLFPGFSLRKIGGETWIALLQEISAVTMILAISFAFYQRFFLKPERFKRSNSADAYVVYFLILLIVTSMMLEQSFKLLASGHSTYWRPFSSITSDVMAQIGVSIQAASTAEQIFYWVHLLVILTFLVFLPGSKHRHMFLAIPNIFWRSLEPKGKLATPNNSGVQPGAKQWEGFDWKQRLDLLSCTECGRCQEVCPAFSASLPLSPKSLIMSLRDDMLGKSNSADGSSEAVISPDILWSCTTCNACVEVCPVHIEQMPKIVDLRRGLVEKGTVEPMLQKALGNLQQKGNSFGKSSKMRPRWTRALDFDIKDARKEPVDYLWFVGDFASYDPRAQIITQNVARILHSAGVDFGIMFDGEQSAGNDVRRVGEEGLFETLAAENIAALEECSFNRIITTDPHSLNTLRNEYPMFGFSAEVFHYSTVLAELLEKGVIKASLNDESLPKTATYHDPCYLGRYNNEFEAPRDIIKASGFTLLDMPRCRENSFCCGAGGGRIWMDDSAMVERPSENRIREALAVNDELCFVVSCPKDLVMFKAAVQSLGVEEKVFVKDISELIR